MIADEQMSTRDTVTAQDLVDSEDLVTLGLPSSW